MLLKNMTDVDAMKKIVKKIDEYETIIIHRHTSPDADAYGAQLGLARAIENNFNGKNVRVVGRANEHLAFLGPMDIIHDSDYEGALVIVVDTANEQRVADQRFDDGQELIVIDHHTHDNYYGDYNWINNNYSSASEMIAMLCQEYGWRLTPVAAQAMYAGILGDTGRITYPNTTPETLMSMAWLLSHDFDDTALINRLESMSVAQFSYRAEVNSMTKYTKSMVAYAKVDKETFNKYALTEDEACSAVGMYNNVIGLNAWVLFVETDTGIRARVRSKSTPILEVVKEFGGGGHPLASGTMLTRWEEADELITALNNLNY